MTDMHVIAIGFEDRQRILQFKDRASAERIYEAIHSVWAAEDGARLPIFKVQDDYGRKLSFDLAGVVDMQLSDLKEDANLSVDARLIQIEADAHLQRRVSSNPMLRAVISPQSLVQGRG